MSVNLILRADSYKHSHKWQRRPGTTNAYYYIEARGHQSQHNVKIDKLVWVLYQSWVKEFLMTPITQADIDEAESIVIPHGLPFDRKGWELMIERHGGYLPLSIRSLPEGSVVNLGVPLSTIENTDDDFEWAAGFVETQALRAAWYGSTVATNSWKAKQILMKCAEATMDIPNVDFKLHDFGARGVSSGESAAIGGSAHMFNFRGSDTLEALLHLRKWYGADMPAFSIPAAEHSTITSWGADKEYSAYDNMLNQFSGMVAIVADSTSLDNALRMFGTGMKPKILKRKGTVVVRPDSGDPETMVLKTINTLMQYYGFTVNTKGCRVLPDCIRVIQGDGMNLRSLTNICKALEINKISLDNVAFGMGGGLLQDVTRDTFKFAMKCSSVVVDGVEEDICKDPITDPGKASKKGRFQVMRSEKLGGCDYACIPRLAGQEWKSQDKLLAEMQGNGELVMREIYRNGKLLVDETFDEIRVRLEKE